MAKYALPHFGEIDTDALEEYYDVDIEFNGKELSLDLNFEGESIDSGRLDSVKKILEKLDEFDQQNKNYIEQDYKDEEADTVKTYVEHHLEEIGKDELAEIIDADKSGKKELLLMKALHLVRVGFYPHGEEIFAIFDYSIGEDYTNYLVVINTDDKGKLVYMTMES